MDLLEIDYFVLSTHIDPNKSTNVVIILCWDDLAALALKLKFLNEGENIEDINHIFIVLNPKLKNAVRMKDFNLSYTFTIFCLSYNLCFI